MSTENTENIQEAQVAPVPATPVTQTETAPIESAPKAEPSFSQDEATKKQNAAFAQMRRAKRELEKKAAQAIPATPPPAVPIVEQPKPEVIVATPAPVQITEGIEIESEKAFIEMSEDPLVKKVSNGILFIQDLVDTNPTLKRIHDISPRLAFQQAKEMFLSKANVSDAILMPKANTPSGGTGAGAHSLDALYEETKKHQVGSPQWFKAVNLFKAETEKQR